MDECSEADDLSTCIFVHCLEEINAGSLAELHTDVYVSSEDNGDEEDFVAGGTLICS